MIKRATRFFPGLCQNHAEGRGPSKTMSLNALADYHMHTPLCHHATGNPVAYVDQAAQRGLTEIGFACHSPMPDPFDDWRMERDELPRYVDMVATARERGRQEGVVVRLGLEVDYLPGLEDWIAELSTLAPWDYLIGSVHYLTDSLVVDHPEHLSQVQARYSPEEMWARYWELFAAACATGQFDFMAHPDLPKKFGDVPEGDLTPYYRQGIDAMKSAKIGTEINTAGLHKPIGEMYPTEAFLTLAAKAAIPLVISSDAHAPEEVGRDFEAARALAKRSGYTSLARYARRERRLLPLD